MSATHRTRKRRQPAVPPPPPDMTELELRELAVLWPRLQAALARDGAGPSASPSGAAGGRHSPAVIDLDTERVITLVEVGVHKVEAEAIRLLNLTPPGKAIAATRDELKRNAYRHAAAVVDVKRMLDSIRAERDAAQAQLRDPAPMHLERQAAAAGYAVMTEASAQITSLRTRLYRLEQRRSTEGVIEHIAIWYAQLRDRKQPLAEHIAEDVRRWVRDARSVLNLRTREARLGYQCPHHRDEPADLIRDRDEATLAPSILAGGRQHVDKQTGGVEQPLTWKYAETVHCPHCNTKWVGVEQMRVLMLMIERIELEEFMTEQLMAAVDDELMRTVLWRCGECGGTSSSEAWSKEWWAERSRRMAGVGCSGDELEEWKAEGSTSKYGLADREVCPRCQHVHSDGDEGAGVEEIPGIALALPPATDD